MKKQELEKKLANAYSKIETPDVIDSILSDAKSKKGILYMEEKNTLWKKGLAFACALVLCAGGLVGYSSYATSKVIDSVIAFDVNPSIELEINKKERVIDVNALNEDAVKVIDGMDLTGSDLDVAVNALIGSMIKQGYINDLSNSILVTVNSKDDQVAEKLQKELNDEVNQLIKENQLEGAVISQKIQMNDDIKQLAEDYGITNGKALLISKILEADPTHTFEDLVNLSIHELNLISKPAQANMETVNVTGQASDKKYIGVDKAVSIALNDAKLNQKDIVDLDVEMDVQMNTMVYEVEFEHNLTEYDYDIHAIDGTILHKDVVSGTPLHEDNNDKEVAVPSVPQSYISKDKAKEIVLSDAGLNENKISQYWIEMDTDDGQVIYEIEFKSGSVEYEYNLLAKDGSILKREIEDKSNNKKDDWDDDFDDRYDDLDDKDDYKKVNTKSAIDKNEAKAIALNHAGFSEKDVKKFKAELDHDDGRMVYEIEFEVDRVEYEYMIDAENGDILESDKDIDD